MIMVAVRVMEPTDIPFAVELTDTEKWEFTRKDFLRLLRLDPRGCFVAADGRERIGLITTTTYDRVAWIGNAIVAKSVRGQGVGGQLIDRAISYIEAKKISKIGLHSYLSIRSLYEKFGFLENALFVRYVGKAEAGYSEAKRLKLNCLNEVAEFDRDRFGADRTRLLELLYRDYPDLCFVVEHHGRVSGYIFAKGSQSGYEIGPWVCNHETSQFAEALLEATLNKMKGKTVEVTVPEENRRADQVLTESGFSSVGKVAEMFRGGVPRRRLDSIFAVGGLEKG